MQKLLNNIRACTLCKNSLPLDPKPILQANKFSKILIAGQAPGAITHEKGIPFDDKSGQRLREWLGVTKAQFYDPTLFAIIPMSFCYPGKGKSGDLPPISLCGQTWRTELLSQLNHIELTIVLGKHAIEWHLKTREPITTLSKNWQQSLTKKYIVLPHPSPRNNIWLKKNQWFEQNAIPPLQKHILLNVNKHPLNLSL